jgi:nucleotide sugar dehydrogenase
MTVQPFRRVAVIGAGKMGLPIACHMAGRGLRVTACDLNSDLVAAINRAECPFDEPGLAELLARARREDRLEATTETADAVAEAEAILVLVPVLLTPEREADLAGIEAVARLIGKSVHAGTLVSFETTLPVGTTRRLGALIAEHGKEAGRDFQLVFSPERVKSRLVLERLGTTPKIVGGLTPACAEAGTAFYAAALGAPVLRVDSLEAAEFAKLADMIYRDANIALANELARYAEALRVDFAAVRAAANTSGEAQLLLPGIGVGGHCTPVYPWFAIGDAKRRGVELALAADARAINDGQGPWMLDRIERATGSLRGRTAVVLGLGFRPGVKEHVCSPAFLLRDDLERRGARVLLHDPLYAPEELAALGFTPIARLEDVRADTLILNTAHAPYEAIDFQALAHNGLRVVADGRNLWDPAAVRDAGLVYLGVGRP